MGLVDYIRYYLSCKFNKKKQIKYSMDKVKERLDLVYILEKLMEIDKMKILLLNED